MKTKPISCKNNVYHLEFTAKHRLQIPGYDTLDVSLVFTSSNKTINTSSKIILPHKLTEAQHEQRHLHIIIDTIDFRHSKRSIKPWQTLDL